MEKITRAKPIHAVAELIWNSLDADATSSRCDVEQNPLGAHVARLWSATTGRESI